MDFRRPTSTAVTGLSFRLLGADDARALSVRQITSPESFDALGHAVPGGLYDPALGAVERGARCPTCGEGEHTCVGHFGHIELAVPVYAPLTFGVLFALLRQTCLYCHRLRAGTLRTAVVTARLRLLDAGLVLASRALEDTLAERDTLDGAAPSEAAQMARLQSILDDCLAQPSDHGASTPDSAVAHDRHTIVSEFLRRAPAGAACAHCRGHPPGLHRHAGTKIFVLPLRDAIATRMRLEGRSTDVLVAENATHLPGKEGASAHDTNLAGASADASDLAGASPDAPQLAGASADAPQLEGASGQAIPAASPAGSPRGMRYLTPLEVMEHMRQLWANEDAVLRAVFGGAGHDVFFVRALAVPPSRFRPPSVLGGQRFEHPQNTYLGSVLRHNARLLALGGGAASGLADAVDAWVRLQEQVNFLVDSSRAPAPSGKVAPPGIKQVLERKEGLFRKHMMGKRVNYAARSVISPDVCIAVDEIGVPAVFATRLSVPEAVAPWNAAALRQAVVNGPDVHPGALAVSLGAAPPVRLESLSRDARAALAARLGSAQCVPEEEGASPAAAPSRLAGAAVVHRHLCDGDVVLMNRQPTLHKPSIMAHRVRVLPGEKTIRMHYANCNTYNADFDGDEMNMHAPQGLLGRAEAAVVAATHRQYLSPTDGGVLRGLIQDHVVSGVLLALKDTLLDRGTFAQLLCAGLADVERRGRCPDGGVMDGRGVGSARLQRIDVPPPAMVRPRVRWTGKQLLGALLAHVLPPGAAGRLNLRSPGRIGAKYWGADHAAEATVLIVDGYWATGVADKAQLGASAGGVVHAVYELHGGAAASSLLTALGRLLTAYDEAFGFTCRLDDLQLTPAADAKRRSIIAAARDAGVHAVAAYAGVAPADVPAAMERIVRDDELARGLDAAMKGVTGRLTSGIIEACLPGGQLRRFPANAMSLMTLSGAKGSQVNFSQIAGALGQQELEGRRVPVMASGRTLPSFSPHDARARAGGYISQRFLTGIRPQEFFFHCMAGREGLIDTAVKTSRSGYLQRCLVKHLEGLSVAYDGSVRDAADGGVVQFRYGDDGLDVCRARMLYDHAFFAANSALGDGASDSVISPETLRAHEKAAKRPGRHDPPASRLRDAVSERFYASAASFARSHSADGSESVLQALCTQFRRAEVDAGEAVGLLAAQSVGEPSTQMTLNTFHFAGFGAKNVTLGIPRLREIVMTASRAIKTPTVTVPLAVDSGAADPSGVRAAAEAVARRMSRLLLRQAVRHVAVVETLVSSPGGRRLRRYAVRVSLSDAASLWDAHCADWEEDVVAPITAQFCPLLAAAIAKVLKRAHASARSVVVVQAKPATSGGGRAGEDGDSASHNRSGDDSESDSEREEAGDDASSGRTRRHSQEKADSDADDASSVLSDDAEDAAAKADGTRDTATDDDTDAVSSDGTPTIGAVRWDGDAFEVDVSVAAAAAPRLHLLDVVEGAGVLGALVLRETPGVGRVSALLEDGRPPSLVAEGSAIFGVLEGASLAIARLSADPVYGPAASAMRVAASEATSNDVYAVLRTLGVEAARATIVREIASVFGVYGISVDARHLSLVADAMTRAGSYAAFNRAGMAASCGASPLLQMTFETTVAFVRSAAVAGGADALRTPSARLVAGKPVALGTGAFAVRQLI